MTHCGEQGSAHLIGRLPGTELRRLQPAKCARAEQPGDRHLLVVQVAQVGVKCIVAQHEERRDTLRHVPCALRGVLMQERLEGGPERFASGALLPRSAHHHGWGRRGVVHD